MNLAKKILIGLVVVLTLAVIFKNALVGLKLDIDKLNLCLTKAMIDIDGITLYNPKKYPDPIMVNVPKVLVDLNLRKVIGGDIHVEALELEMKEFTVVKNKDGEVNINELKAVAEAKEEQPAVKGAEPAPKPKGEKPEISVDNLHLKIGRVVFKDYSKGEEPVVKEYNINLNEKHENIKSLEAVVTLIVFKVVTKTNIAAIANVDLGGLQDVLSGTLKGTTEAATQAVGTATDTLKDAAGTLKGTAESLKDKIKLPFGK